MLDCDYSNDYPREKSYPMLFVTDGKSKGECSEGTQSKGFPMTCTRFLQHIRRYYLLSSIYVTRHIKEVSPIRLTRIRFRLPARP